MVFNTTYLEVGPDANPGAAVGDFEALVQPIVPVINWLPGRTAVRYHPDVLDTLAVTPIDGRIPVQALYRLPQWGLFLDCPFLTADAGVFVSVDPGAILEHHTPMVDSVDELMLTFVLPGGDPPLLQANIRLSEDTIAGALAAQDAEWRTSPPAVFRNLVHRDADQLSDHLGQSFPHVLATVVSMLLYLCVEEPDISQRPLPVLDRTPGGDPLRSGGDVQVVDAGWRLGAALHDAWLRYETEPGDPAGRHVAPHLRRAHWHTVYGRPNGRSRVPPGATQ